MYWTLSFISSLACNFKLAFVPDSSTKRQPKIVHKTLYYLVLLQNRFPYTQHSLITSNAGQWIWRWCVRVCVHTHSTVCYATVDNTPTQVLCTCILTCDPHNYMYVHVSGLRDSDTILFQQSWKQCHHTMSSNLKESMSSRVHNYSPPTLLTVRLPNMCISVAIGHFTTSACRLYSPTAFAY